MNKPIEDMDLSELKVNLTELSDEELLSYLNGTRNNRMKKPIPKKKGGKKKKEAPEDALVGLLRSMGPDAMAELAKMMEGMGDE